MDDVLTRAGDRVAKEVGGDLSGFRWAIGIRGLFAIALGAVILIWPNISLLALTLVFGAFALFYGITTLGAVFRAKSWQTRLGLLLIAAIDIAAGVVVIVWPDLSSLALLYAIGAWAIAIGIITLASPLWVPGMSGENVALLVLSGIVSILFGSRLRPVCSRSLCWPWPAAGGSCSTVPWWSSSSPPASSRSFIRAIRSQRWQR